MVNITNVLSSLTAPTGLWPKLFDWFASWVSNYGWTVVLFTLAVKLIVSPLDFYNRYSTRKNTLIQKRLAGQVQKINYKYQNNREEANRQVSLLYKREGYNMVGSCVFMLINMIVTMVVFFTFFNSLRTISSYKMLSQYDSLQTTYHQTLSTTGSVEEAESKTLETFLEFEDKNSWLWVKNVWRNDSKVNSIPSYSDLVKVAKNSNKEEHINFINSVSETDYNTVMKSVESKNSSWNGYFIIAVLVILSTLLSQYLSEKMNDTKGEKKQDLPQQNQATMKMMKLILPAIILIFVLTNTASFGIYILIGNLFGIITNLLFGIIVKKLTQKEENKYLDYLEKEAIKNKNVKKEQKPHMVTYKKLGDRLWTQSK